jgi:hypothetical protein
MRALRRTMIVNVALFVPATRDTALGGGIILPPIGFGRRKLMMPNLEQVTFSVPTVTPTTAAISPQLAGEL